MEEERGNCKSYENHLKSERSKIPNIAFLPTCFHENKIKV